MKKVIIKKILSEVSYTDDELKRMSKADAQKAIAIMKRDTELWNRKKGIEKIATQAAPKGKEKTNTLKSLFKKKDQGISKQMVKTIADIVHRVINSPEVQRGLAKDLEQIASAAAEKEVTKTMSDIPSMADTVPSKTRTDRASTTQAMREEDIIEHFINNFSLSDED